MTLRKEEIEMISSALKSAALTFGMLARKATSRSEAERHIEWQKTYAALLERFAA